MTSKELLIHEVQTLPENLTEQVLDYLQYLKMKKLQVSALPEGRPADYLLQFAGAISKEDLKIMSEEIEKGCERVDQVAGIWKDRKFSVEKYVRNMRKNSRSERNCTHE